MRIQEAFRFFSRYAGLIVAAAVVIVLMGGWLDGDHLKSIIPGLLVPLFIWMFFHKLRQAQIRSAELEKSLKISAGQFRDLIESSPDAIVIMNREGLIKLVNRQTENLFGYAREELLGRPLEMLMPERFREAHRAHRAGYARSPKIRTMGGGLELAALHKDGTEFSTEINLSPMETREGLVVISTIRDITERKQAEALIQRAAYEDAVSGLPNRNSLNDRLMDAVRQDNSEGKPMALLLMDLERFKEVNDTFGHQLGDRLIGDVGRRIQKAVREDDFVARLGGDEFAILLSRLRGLQDIDRVIQKIQKALEPSFELEGIPVAVEAAIGIALYPSDGRDAGTLLRHADVAMYEAKKSGRGYARYLPEKDHYNPRRLALIGELRYAIEHDELLLHYQPKIDLKSGRCIGVEALVRWKHPLRGMIRPDEFIPAAERTGLIKPLTAWVIDAAVRQGRAWSNTGLPVEMAVNVSVRNLLDSGFPGWLAGRLQDPGLPPGHVRLEITESAIMTEPDQSLEVLRSIKAIGVHLSIDDFGKGYTSLSLLEKMPVDEIKVDRSFVHSMSPGNEGSVFVQSMVDLGHNLGLPVVAEGVENQETYERLCGLGCDQAQGYYMSRPQPADEMTRWLEESPWGLSPES